nr:cytochrome P450 [Thermoleophilaceae bacterium]
MMTSLPLRARGAAASLAGRLPIAAARPLADPPPGSGLSPVMGEPGLPLTGNSLGFLRDSLGHARRFHDRFGTVFWTGAFGTKLVLVLGPDAIGTVLANRDKAFANKQGWD